MTLKLHLPEELLFSSGPSTLEDAFTYFVLAIVGIALAVSRATKGHRARPEEEDSK